ncbi:MAG: hypothetical protein ACK4N5_15545, partial [Myxococcales bacterium]
LGQIGLGNVEGAVAGDKVPKMSGNVAVEARLEGGLADPAIDGEITLSRVQVEDFDIGDAYLRARFEKDEVFIDELVAHVGEGSAHVTGHIGTTGRFPAKIEADIRDVEFARVLAKVGLTGAWVNFTARGKAKVEGELLPLKLTGPASIDIARFRVHDRSFERADRINMLEVEQAHVDTVADFTLDRVRLSGGGGGGGEKKGEEGGGGSTNPQRRRTT